MKELYICGNEKEINEVIAYCKFRDLISKEKIFLIDLLPELTKEYIKREQINRKDNLYT